MAGNHSLKKYIKIYVALLVLFIISVAGPEIADMIHLTGVTRLVVVLTTAFGIALVKAYMVAAHFMHLKTEKIYAPYILLVSIALMVVFFYGTAPDAMKPSGRNWKKVYEEPAIADSHHVEHGAH